MTNASEGAAAQADEGVVLRKARRSDATALAPLIIELAGSGVTDAQAVRRFRRLLRAPSYECYVLDLDGTAIAVWVGRSGYLFAAEAPAIQMIGIVVSPEHRGSGLGERLMQECPPGHRYCQSWHVTQHDGLHEYYERLGWSATGTRFVRHASTPPDRRPLLSRIASKVLSA